MIGTDVATRLKRQFGDESGVQVTDDDIIRWINDAQREITRTNNLLQARGTISIVAGQSEYPFPSNVLSLRSVKYDGAKIPGYSLLEFEEYLATIDAKDTASGTPVCFTIWDKKIKLYPNPDVSITDGLTILFIARPTDIAVLGDSLSLPDEYFNRVVEFCMQQAYEMDEDWNAAANKAAQFTGGLAQLQETEMWDRRDKYPTITVDLEDM